MPFQQHHSELADRRELKMIPPYFSSEGVCVSLWPVKAAPSPMLRRGVCLRANAG